MLEHIKRLERELAEVKAKLAEIGGIATNTAMEDCYANIRRDVDELKNAVTSLRNESIENIKRFDNHVRSQMHWSSDGETANDAKAL